MASDSKLGIFDLNQLPYSSLAEQVQPSPALVCDRLSCSESASFKNLYSESVPSTFGVLQPLHPSGRGGGGRAVARRRVPGVVKPVPVGIVVCRQRGHRRVLIPPERKSCASADREAGPVRVKHQNVG